LRESLAFIPLEIPIPGEASRSITFGLVREGATGKPLSVGLILLDIPSMEKQWEQADLEARENDASPLSASLPLRLRHTRAYGKLPDALDTLALRHRVEYRLKRPTWSTRTYLRETKADMRFDTGIVPAGGNLSEEEANRRQKFELAATPVEYGKTGRRSFILDSAESCVEPTSEGSVADFSGSTH